MIDDLMCYDGMYLYRLGGGWLHDRSNLVLIYYNHILYVRNSNKLETKSVAQVRSLAGRLQQLQWLVCYEHQRMPYVMDDVTERELGLHLVPNYFWWLNCTTQILD
jgi:hypothetical protein